MLQKVATKHKVFQYDCLVSLLYLQAVYRTSYVKLLALLASLCGTVLQRAVFMSNERDRFYWALGIVAGIGIFYLLMSVGYSFLLCAKQKSFKFTCSIHLALGFIYFSANNFLPLIRMNGEEIGCETNCQQTLQAAELTLLVVVVISYLALTHCISKHVEATENKKNEEQKKLNQPGCILAAETLVLFIELDSVFTLIDRTPGSSLEIPETNTSIACLTPYFYASWINVGLILAVYALVLYFVLNVRCVCSCKTIFCNLLPLYHIFCLGLYLLADNTLPLSCLELVKESPLYEDIARLAGSGTVLISVGFTLAGICGFPCLSKNCQNTFHMRKQEEPHPL